MPSPPRRVPSSTERPWGDADSARATQTRALIEIAELPDNLLELVAYGNEDKEYGEVAQGEIDRR